MLSPLKNLLHRIGAYLRTSPEEEYLSRSSDLADLERRLRRLERQGSSSAR
jgi:hypothetical protein